MLFVHAFGPRISVKSQSSILESQSRVSTSFCRNRTLRAVYNFLLRFSFPCIRWTWAAFYIDYETTVCSFFVWLVLLFFFGFGQQLGIRTFLIFLVTLSLVRFSGEVLLILHVFASNEKILGHIIWANQHFSPWISTLLSLSAMPSCFM